MREQRCQICMLRAAGLCFSAETAPAGIRHAWDSVCDKGESRDGGVVAVSVRVLCRLETPDAIFAVDRARDLLGAMRRYRGWGKGSNDSKRGCLFSFRQSRTQRALPAVFEFVVAVTRFPPNRSKVFDSPDWRHAIWRARARRWVRIVSGSVRVPL